MNTGCPYCGKPGKIDAPEDVFVDGACQRCISEVISSDGNSVYVLTAYGAAQLRKRIVEMEKKVL